jgi:hypothetical protein
MSIIAKRVSQATSNARGHISPSLNLIYGIGDGINISALKGAAAALLAIHEACAVNLVDSFIKPAVDSAFIASYRAL